MRALAGVGGSLFPGRYLEAVLTRDLPPGLDPGEIERHRRAFGAWWQRVEAQCGPVTALRTLFDLVAMPLAGLLGFRARHARFERTRAEVSLETRGGAVVGLVLLPWRSARSHAWRDLLAFARTVGADWCLLVAPPFVSVVDSRGSAVRRSVDFTLPEALEPASFTAFWILARAGAFDLATETAEPPGGACRVIERLAARGAQFQDRVREDLQLGVVEALSALAREIDRSRSVQLTAPALDQALTLVYRILFLLFAESRDLVPRHHPIYSRAYSMTTLCREALDGRPAPCGLWDGLAAVTRLSRVGCRADDLIVRPFNGKLFARRSAPSLEARRQVARPTRSTAMRDAAMGQALVALGTRAGGGGREAISYADLGVEQLGAVYERVLDLEPTYVGRPGFQGRPAEAGLQPAKADQRPAKAGRQNRHSIHRKQTGTFYTPQSLAEFVVRRTLAPLVRGASADAVLALRVVDPAMGSGAFLVAACRYLAGAYERALVDEGRCHESDLDPEARANVRRLIAERCLAGVDTNPVAVQLARLSLWLTSLARGKPLGFLDHRLRTGNSLIGASPDDLWRASGLRPAADGELPLFDAARLQDTLRQISRPLVELSSRRDDSVDDVHAKEVLWNRLTNDQSPLAPWRLACSLWCARWFWPDGHDVARHHGPPSPAELRAALDAILRGDTTLGRVALERWLATAREVAGQLGFFHWPLEFADVFYDDAGHPRSRPGFDAVIGNPPWEMLRADPVGSRRSADGARNTTRRELVRFIRDSGLYGACDRGHVNLYQPFLERALSLCRPQGRVGLVLPWGLAADEGATSLRTRLLDGCALDTVVGLDNRHGLFPIHRGLRFLVVVANPGGAAHETRARFGVRTAAELEALPDSDEPGDESAFPLRLSRSTISAIGGVSKRIPDLRRTRDLEWLERLAREHPPLGGTAGWRVEFGRELNATEDRCHFGGAGLPIVEGKHVAPFVTGRTAATSRISREAAIRLLPDRRFERPRLAYRDVSGVGNRLSLIAAILPGGVVSTHTLFCLRTPMPLLRQQFLCGLFNSYVLNAIVRMLMGGHVTTGLVESLPVPQWSGSRDQRRIARLSGRLSRPGASSRLGAALQAAVARLYGFDERTFDDLLQGFPLVPAQDRLDALRALGAQKIP